MLRCTICIAAMHQKPFKNRSAQRIYHPYPRDRTNQAEDETRRTMNLIRNYRNWRRYRDTVSELNRLSNRHCPRRHRLRRPQVDLRNFARVDLLPDPDGYGRRSPPPDRWPSKRRPPHLLPRRALFPKKASPLRKNRRTEFRQSRSSSPAMTDRPVLPSSRGPSTKTTPAGSPPPAGVVF
jgi:uncharacterized protein YjiS (DUF1127 family)